MSSDPPDDDANADKGEDTRLNRDRLETEVDRAIDGFDQGLVDVLAWLLDTETRARIYIYLRKEPWRTSDEIATGTGLYPSTVRESLAALNDDGVVERRKRESDGAGNNPYEYTAVAPSDLVGELITPLQDQLNAICNLDRYLQGSTDDTAEPVRIEVSEESGDG